MRVSKSIRIDDALFRRFKAMVYARGETVSAVIERFIKFPYHYGSFQTNNNFPGGGRYDKTFR